MAAEPALRVEHQAFRAMGSSASVIVVDGPAGLAGLARERIDRLEQRWSRFLPTSEVSRLNRLAGRWVAVSPETSLLVHLAVEAWQLTGGMFDPTVLGPMLRAGYDRPFEQLVDGARPAGSDLVVACSDIEARDGELRLPAGSGFDPGGIGKGLAADLVVETLMGAGAAGACVNLGGDVRVAGVGPGGGAWTVAVEHPERDEPLVLLGLRGGAVATSTTLRRRWRARGLDRHHLIDPWTGEPSDTDLVLASAVAGEGWRAEVMAKACLLRGSERAFDLIDGSVEALAVDRGGSLHATEGLHAFLGGRPIATRPDRGPS